MTESITDLKVILSSENPSMEAPAGFLEIPVDLNKDADKKKADAIYLAITREPNNRPITDVTVIQGDSASIPPPSGYIKLPEDLNENASGDYIFLCYRRGSGVPIADIVIQSTPENNQIYPRIRSERYDRNNVDLNDNAGGDYIYLYYLNKQPDYIPDFSDGIDPGLIETEEKEYEVSRIQIDYEKELVWTKKLEIVKRDTIGAMLGREYKYLKKEGMKREHKESISRSMGISAGMEYAQFSLEVNNQIGHTSQNSYSTIEYREVEEKTILPTVDYNLVFVYVVVLDILRVMKIPNGDEISKAQSFSIDSGVFTKKVGDDWG